MTGGAGGIGAATCRRLAAEGARVAVTDMDLDRAREVAGEIGADAYALDVTDATAARRVVEEVGVVDVLVNNAGTDEFGFFLQTDESRWERVLSVNLKGVMAVTHAVLPGMHERGYGRIVNVGSEAGRVGSPGSASYSAAKAGVEGFTRAIARESARFGVTSNAVAPGPIETPLLMSAPKQLGELGEKLVKTMVGGTAMRRLGQPDEVAGAIAFLASDDASFVTGETLGVSGGLGFR